MNMVAAHTKLEERFINWFSGRGYRQIGAVQITSKVDKTVYLVNSATNLFKKYFGERNIGIFAVQKSMRTQILSDYYQETKETEYPSFFESYGVYVSPNRIDNLLYNTIGFFTSIGLDRKSMRFRVSFDDPILTDAVVRTNLVPTIMWDSRSDKYDHVYGNDLTGRVIKLDYEQRWANKYKNLCYFILIYDGGVPVGVEMATSDQLILMRMQNLQYAICASKVSDILPLTSFNERRFADSIVGIAHLSYEGIRPNSSNTNGRTVKKYIAASLHFGKKLGYLPSQFITIIDDYIMIEYGNPYNREKMSAIYKYLQMLFKDSSVQENKEEWLKSAEND